ncbi:MAG: DMT family transporter [Candidatus Thorarchaeota archaeon]|jgi:drug/metabolite transporter (DMT)-like permease
MTSEAAETEMKDGVTNKTTSSRRHYKAALEALFVTVLWSSSWVIIKFGLEEIPPLTFAGLRYTLASVILLVMIMMRAEYRGSMRNKNSRWWGTIILYGVIFVSVTQGAQFVGLGLLEAITVSLLLNLTPIIVLFLGVALLSERPTLGQTVLILLGIVGVLLYFYPIDLSASELLGLIVMLIGVMANAFSSIMGRSINRKRTAPPIVVTGVSMAVGSIFLLFFGLILEGITVLSLLSWFYIIWLSVVNTAIAFTIWNRAMQTLRAVDSTIINSTMLPQIVLLSIVFLGEMPGLLDWLGIGILGACVFLVQVSQARRLSEEEAN